MSVYIKGMELPTACFECELSEGGLHWCRAAKREIEKPYDAVRSSFCPLVPVPQHGRLIDADAEIKKINRLLTSEFLIRQDWSIDIVSLKCALRILSDAPPVIPADPDKEGEHGNA